MLILGIETSCDETAVALVEAKNSKLRVVKNLVSSQVKTHSPFGGVVPNLAAREHIKNLIPLLEKLLNDTKTRSEDISLIAATQGPGLIPALLIGANAAKALAYVWKKPLVGIHHIEGHIYANFVGVNPKSKIQNPKQAETKFPILALIVSGGHTQLIFMKKHLDYKIIGETLDDAAGEAFDKVAKILGLGYPGGPIISELAEKYLKTSRKARLSPSDKQVVGISQSRVFKLPRPMINSKNLNFSFSGLKTAALYTVRDNPEILKNKKHLQALCREFQQAVIDVLISKTIQAAKKYKPKTILLGGGVSANQELRKQLGEAIKTKTQNTRCQIPDTKYSLDNAAMIGAAGYFRYTLTRNKKIFYDNWKNLEADASLKL